MKRMAVALVLPVLAVSLCGCGAAGEAPAETVRPAEAETGPEAENMIETVYRAGKEHTVCIFTSGGNNGAGFVYHGHYVITNEHVLYGADGFTILTPGGQEYEGEVIFTDRETDIAVIKAEGLAGGSVIFGDPETVSAGDLLVCIGNPAAGEPFSFCTGKRLELPAELQEKIDRHHRYIPADADIVSGYSGGPVFNLDGDLIGICNAAYAGDLSAYQLEHLGLIIPLSRVRQEIEEACR